MDKLGIRFNTTIHRLFEIGPQAPGFCGSLYNDLWQVIQDEIARQIVGQDHLRELRKRGNEAEIGD